MMKLLATLLIIGGLVVASVYFVRSKKQQEPQSYVKSETIKEEVKETVFAPEQEQSPVQETEETVVEVK